MGNHSIADERSFSPLTVTVKRSIALDLRMAKLGGSASLVRWQPPPGRAFRQPHAEATNLPGRLASEAERRYGTARR
jgi:hypothetical protein